MSDLTMPGWESAVLGLGMVPKEIDGLLTGGVVGMFSLLTWRTGAVRAMAVWPSNA